MLLLSGCPYMAFKVSCTIWSYLQFHISQNITDLYLRKERNSWLVKNIFHSIETSKEEQIALTLWEGALLKSAAFRACIVITVVKNAVIRTTILRSCCPQNRGRGINIWFLYSEICIAHASRSCSENSDYLEQDAVMKWMHYATGLQSIWTAVPACLLKIADYPIPGSEQKMWILNIYLNTISLIWQRLVCNAFRVLYGFLHPRDLIH